MHIVCLFCDIRGPSNIFILVQDLKIYSLKYCCQYFYGEERKIFNFRKV